jgi:hypothetical protein
MKTTIDNASQFRDAFRALDRENQFSYEGMGLLFEYFEELNPNMTLDVIAVCCAYSEDTIDAIAGNNDIDLSEASDGMDESSAYGLEQIEDAKLEIVMAYLNDHTTVIGETSSGIVYADF